MFSTAKQIAVSLYEYAHLLGHPSHWPLLLHPERQHAARADQIHLEAALDWLCRAQDAGGGRGVSAGYFLRRGWMPPYPETTGYIIPTLLACRDLGADYVDRARRMGDWEIEIQLPTGGVRGGIGLNDYPIVFNTGQVMLGWCALFRHTEDERYLHAARCAADWLVDAQEQDGRWLRHTYLEAPRAYHSRVAWPLLELSSLCGKERYREAAQRFLSWLLPQQRENGFFPHMALQPQALPITHTIAYTLRGLLESARLLGDDGRAAHAAALHATEQLLSRHPHLVESGHLSAALNADWQGQSPHMCLTGNAQLALILYALSAHTTAPFARAARALVQRLKTHHALTGRHPGLRGGLPSSHPLGGDYVPYAILNWGTKFFADALLVAAKTPPH
jgi:hypothetical protein